MNSAGSFDGSDGRDYLLHGEPEPVSASRDWLPAYLFTICAHLLVLAMVVTASDPPGLQIADIDAPPLVMSIDLQSEPSDRDSPREVSEPVEPEEVEAENTALPIVEAAPVPTPIPLPPLPSLTPTTSSDASSLDTDLDALVGLGGGSATTIGQPSPSPLGGSSVAHSGRHGVTKQALLARHGGSRHTEAALMDGLRWLASVQDLSTQDQRHFGRWDSDGFMTQYLARNPDEPDADYSKRCAAEGKGYGHIDLGLTALVLMAFSGAGHTRDSGPFARNVEAAIGYLLRSQDSVGAFVSPVRISAVDMYDHSVALLALADVFAMTGDKRLERPVRLGLNYLVRSQQPGSATGAGAKPGGGWDYKPWADANEVTRNDLSITGFAVMALSACRQAGIEPPEEAVAAAIAMIKRHTTADGTGIYADADPAVGRTGQGMTAVNLFSRRLLGQPPSTPIQQAQAMQIARRLPDWETSREMVDDPYMWYYAALALMLEGGQRWQAFNVAMKSTLTAAQEKDAGSRSGSWPPTTFYGQRAGGRVYATAISCLCLEVYYRYVPESLKTSNVDYAPFWDR